MNVLSTSTPGASAPKQTHTPRPPHTGAPRTHATGGHSGARHHGKPQGGKGHSRGRFQKNSAPSRPSDGRIYVDPIKDQTPEKLRVSVIGGAEEVGRNCTMIEYGGDIIVIDLGLQFPEEDMPGIDYIIPNMSYLKERKKDIKGVIITHGHMDHIGAIPHVMNDLGNPIIYTGNLSQGIITRRHENYKSAPKLKFYTVEDGSKVKIGKFEVEFVHINHNIPNSFILFIKTPVGNIIHTGDFKFDKTPINDMPVNFERLAELGSRGVFMAMVDSTNAAQPGEQISEYAVTSELDKIFEKTNGRIIVGTFASNLNRIQQIVTLAEKYGRKVILEGRSINDNVDISHKLKYFAVKPDTLITSEAYVKNPDRYPDEKLIIIGTGAQGERNAFLMKYASEEHRFLSAKPGDSVIFSSSVIPGNERTVMSLKDALSRKGCHVIHYQMMDVHAGGHARQEDLKLFMKILKPKYYVPIECNHHILRIHGELAMSEGYDEKNVFITENGRIMEFDQLGQGELTTKYMPADYVFVDGLGVGDSAHVVLRDRLIMAQEGMVVVITTIDHKTGKLIGNPDIISRGFIYIKENKGLIEETRQLVKKICNENDPAAPAFDDYIKNNVRDELGEFLWKKTKKRPMVLPVVIQV